MKELNLAVIRIVTDSTADLPAELGGVGARRSAVDSFRRERDLPGRRRSRRRRVLWHSLIAFCLTPANRPLMISKKRIAN